MSGTSAGRPRLALVLTWVLGVLLAVTAFMLVRDLEQARARAAFVDARRGVDVPLHAAAGRRVSSPGARRDESGTPDL